MDAFSGTTVGDDLVIRRRAVGEADGRQAIDLVTEFVLVGMAVSHCRFDFRVSRKSLQIDDVDDLAPTGDRCVTRRVKVEVARARLVLDPRMVQVLPQHLCGFAEPSARPQTLASRLPRQPRFQDFGERRRHRELRSTTSFFITDLNDHIETVVVADEALPDEAPAFLCAKREGEGDAIQHGAIIGGELLDRAHQNGGCDDPLDFLGSCDAPGTTNILFLVELLHLLKRRRFPVPLQLPLAPLGERLDRRDVMVGRDQPEVVARLVLLMQPLLEPFGVKIVPINEPAAGKDRVDVADGFEDVTWSAPGSNHALQEPIRFAVVQVRSKHQRLAPRLLIGVAVAVIRLHRLVEPRLRLDHAEQKVRQLSPAQ